MEFLGLLGFLILIYWRPQDFIPAVKDWRLVFVVMGITLLLWISRKATRREGTKLLYIPQDYFILGLYIAVILSTFAVRWLWYTREMTVWFAKLVIIYFLVADILNSEDRLHRFSYALIVLTTFIAGIAILQRFGIDITGVGMAKGGRIQGAGIYHNPNYLAYSLILILPLQYYMFRKDPSLIWRIFSFFSLVISIWAVIWTKSRGGMLSLVLTLIFIFSQARRPVTKFILLGFSFFIIQMVFTIAPRFNIPLGRDPTIWLRIEAQYVAFQLLKEHPFIGVGIHQFNEYFPPKTTHNSFALVGAELGLIGLFMWLGFLYHNFKILYKYDKEEKYSMYIKALQASLAAYGIMAFFVTFSYRITLFILTGMVSALIKQIEREKGEMSSPSPFNIKDLRNILLLEIGVVILWHLMLKYSKVIL